MDIVWGTVWPAVPAYASRLYVIGQDDVADTGDHKGPPCHSSPPSPLRVWDSREDGEPDENGSCVCMLFLREWDSQPSSWKAGL